MKTKNNAFSFFKEMPFDLEVQTYQSLSSEELFKIGRTLSKKSSAAAITVLCSRLDAKSIDLQRYLFCTRVKPIFSPHLDVLPTIIDKAMQSQFSNSTHKLGALLFIAATKNISFEIPEELVLQSLEALVKKQDLHSCYLFATLIADHPIKRIDAWMDLAIENYERADKETKYQAMIKFRAFAFYTSPEKLTSVISAVLSKARSDESSRRQLIESNWILPIAALYVQDTHLIDELMNISIEMLYDADYTIYSNAVDILSSCARHANKEQMNRLIDSVTFHLSNDDATIRTRALYVLEKMLKMYVTSDHIALFIDVMVKEINNPDSDVQVRLLYTLSALAPKANTAQLDVFIKTCLDALTDKNISESAESNISRLIPYLAENQRHKIITRLIEDLKPNRPGSLCDLLELEQFAPFATQKHLDQFILKMVVEMNIDRNAMSIFASLMKYAIPNQHIIFISVVEKFLMDLDQYLEKKNLDNILSELAKLVPVTRIDELIHHIDFTMNAFNNEKATDNALIRFRVLVNYATSQSIAYVLDKMINMLHNFDKENIWDTLTVCLEYLPPTDKLIAELKATLENPTTPLHEYNAALGTLGACATHSTKEQIDVLISWLPTLFSDEHTSFFIVKAMITLAEHVKTSSQTEILFGMLVKKIDEPDDPDNPEGLIAVEVLTALSRLVRHAIPSQMEKLIGIFLNCLNDTRYFVRRTSLDHLSCLMINNETIHSYCAEYYKTHNTSTMEHELLKLTLNLYFHVYEPASIKESLENHSQEIVDNLEESEKSYTHGT